MTDQYWISNRAEYLSIPIYVRLADQQFQRRLKDLLESDAVLYGIKLTRDDQDFPPFGKLAAEVFGWEPDDVTTVELKPDPWKAPGFWRITGLTEQVHMEAYVHVDKVRLILGLAP